MKVTNVVKTVDPKTFEGGFCVTTMLSNDELYEIGDGKTNFGKEFATKVGSFIPERCSGIQIYQITSPIAKVAYRVDPDKFINSALLKTAQVENGIVQLRVEVMTMVIQNINEMMSEIEFAYGKDADVFMYQMKTSKITNPKTLVKELKYVVRFALITKAFREENGLVEHNDWN